MDTSKWISVKDKLPVYNFLCLIVHYNNHKELAYYDGQNWWEQSNSLSHKDILIKKEFWPDYWIRVPDSPMEGR